MYPLLRYLYRPRYCLVYPAQSSLSLRSPSSTMILLVAAWEVRVLRSESRNHVLLHSLRLTSAETSWPFSA